jgi:hypothetical protein
MPPFVRETTPETPEFPFAPSPAGNAGWVETPIFVFQVPLTEDR